MIKILDQSDNESDDEQPTYSPQFSVAFFDQSSLFFACPSIQNVLSSRTCDQCGIFHGSQALMKNHNFLNITKRQHKIKAKKVLSSRKDEVLVVLNGEDPEWMSTEDVEITPPEFCEVIGEDQILPVFTTDENFSMPWESLFRSSKTPFTRAVYYMKSVKQMSNFFCRKTVIFLKIRRLRGRRAVCMEQDNVRHREGMVEKGQNRQDVLCEQL